MSFLIDNFPKILRESYKSEYTNIILDIEDKVIKLLAIKSTLNSYTLKILDYPQEKKVKLIKIVKVLTNVPIKHIKEELNNLPVTINNVHFDDIPKIEYLLNAINVKYIIT